MARIRCVDLSGEYAEIGPELEAAALGVLRSGAYVLGPETRAFEEELAAWCGARFAVGVGSGTEALVLALRAVGVRPGDEVAVPAFTFFATVEAVRLVGAEPVFVDVESDGFNLDPRALEAVIGPRTRAVVPVHLFGRCADLAAIRAVAGERAIVEDAAQAIGAERAGRRAGGGSLAAGFSFYPSKNLAAAGDGGAVTTDDPGVAERLRLLGNHGSAERDVHRCVGTTSRLDSLQAALLRVKLRHLDAWNRARAAVARRYDERLADCPGIQRPQAGPDERPCWNQYAIRCRPADRRERVCKALEAEGVEWRHFYPTPVYRQRALGERARPEGHCSEAERACREVVCLPIHPRLSESEVDRVVAAIRSNL